MLKPFSNLFKKMTNSTNDNLAKVKQYILTLGKNEVLVVNRKDGTRDFYTYSMLTDEIIKKAESKTAVPGFTFFFLDEEEL